MKRVILIGGSPTAGKSHTARKLAEALKLPWISTDTIREQMRNIVSKKDFPQLFHHAKATPNRAVEFLTHNTAEEIVRHQNEESVDVWKGVIALVETDYVWESFVVEGVAVLPRLVAKLRKNRKDIKAVFLIDENKARVRKTIFTRGLWDDAWKYPDSIKEKEVEWVLAFNKYIKKEAKKYRLPVVSIDTRKNNLKRMKKLLRVNA
ncbi:hypothetical protein HY493_01725 [Candidatus Woesearchaeota archaeon]|nr:hypothetical protein [Candidatus Woesearchaeota archaeon]